jgi:hypothetical protein
MDPPLQAVEVRHTWLPSSTKYSSGKSQSDGVDYTVAVDPEGIRLTGKGKRRPEVELRWRDLLSGEAAMAIALNASLTKRQTATRPETEQSPDR